MPGRRKDMEFHSIAEKYPELRGLTEENVRVWIHAILDHGGLEPGDCILDLGCGTGKFTIPLARAGLQADGLDASQSMLATAQARDEDQLVKWRLGDATDLPFMAGVFDACFQSMMIMHVTDRVRLFSEIRRVLKEDGVCLVRMASHDQIRRLDWYQFFPQLLAETLARCPDTPKVMDYMQAAGFSDVDVVTIVERSQTSPLWRLEQIRNKAFSDLRTLEEDDFQAGLARYESYIESLPEPGSPEDNKLLLVIGRQV